jgi:hypothetical protein
LDITVFSSALGENRAPLMVRFLQIAEEEASVVIRRDVFETMQAWSAVDYFVPRYHSVFLVRLRGARAQLSLLITTLGFYTMM